MAFDASKMTDTQTAIISPTFHTLQVHQELNPQAPPVITLNSDDRLVISFDELADERRYLRYELIHCNARWRPDGMLAPEYVDGFNEATIDDYDYSRATTVRYINYRLTFPSPDMRPLISGNYLLRVYDEQDPDATLLQVRFSVLEPMTTVTATVTSRTDIDYNDRHQQLTIGVDATEIPAGDMYSSMLINVMQNGRHDNMAYTARPTRIAGTTAWFEHDRNLIFPAGNEYRRMEIVSTTYPGMHVEDISYSDPYYHADLMTDRPRVTEPYSYDQTQAGRFVIREYNSDDPDTEADYIVTHFTLDSPELPQGDVFIDGDLTQRRFNPDSRMVYNRGTGRYEAALLLKQGAYNYEYLAVMPGSTTGLTAPIEGNKYQTVNEYTVYVYYREPGGRYDRLVGITSATSGR